MAWGQEGESQTDTPSPGASAAKPQGQGIRGSAAESPSPAWPSHIRPAFVLRTCCPAHPFLLLCGHQQAGALGGTQGTGNPGSLQRLAQAREAERH